jgi:hypothetical protein
MYFFIICIIIVIFIFIFLFRNSNKHHNHFTLKQVKKRCKQKISKVVAPQVINCETIYEIEKDSVPTREIVINENYLFTPPDIQYYNNIQEEYNNRTENYVRPQESRIIRQEPHRNQVIQQVPNNLQQEPYRNQNLQVIQQEQEQFPFQTLTQPERRGPLNVDIPEMEFFADNENVHNNTIQKNIKQRYTTLDSIDITNDISNKISEWTNADSKINDIVNQIKARNSTITNLNGDTEMEILTKVWNNASDNNERDAIIAELKDSVNEQGKIYCPTGTSVRLVNATYINDPEKMPKTKGMIHAEMMNTASNTRDNLEKTSEYMTANDTEKDEIFKKTIIEKYETDYVGILSNNEIKEMTNEWIDLV